MHPFRSILAVLLALLVASPLCCCAAKAADAPAASCCEGGSGTPDDGPHACACPSKEPQEFAKHFELSPGLAAPLPPETATLSQLAPPLSRRMPRAMTPHTGCDPPRHLLARYSRWLL